MPVGRTPPVVRNGPTPPQPVAAVLVAAGKSKRMTATGQDPAVAAPKQWQLLAGRPLVLHSFEFFDRLASVTHIAIALEAESFGDPERRGLFQSAHGKTILFAPGGPTRQGSVWQALRILESASPEIVAVHDAARPFPPRARVEQAFSQARAGGGAILAQPIVETVKRADAQGRIVETLNRRELWAAQTPQVFRFAPLVEAYRAALPHLSRFTDDASIFEAHGGAVQIIESPPSNFKITRPEDFERAERHLESQDK